MNIFVCWETELSVKFSFSFSSGQQVVNDYTHKIVIKEDGTQSLIISPAMPADSGEWAVIAQNRAGKASISMTLTVEGIYSVHILGRGKEAFNYKPKSSYFNFLF